MVRIIVSLTVALICPILITPLFIAIQRKHKIGQKIRQEGPDLHQHKMGTPTMGGLIIFFAIALSLMVFQPEDINVWAAFLLLCSFGLVGFIDDFIKYYKGRSLGLKARVKVILQLLICAVFLLWFFQKPSVNHRIFIPFFQETLSVPLTFYFPLITLVFISTTNSVNLTDGLDGLATGLMIIVLIAFAIIAFSQGEKSLGIFCLMIIFSCLGFLKYNFHPAKIFLGDVGSLGLGGVLAAIAFFTRTELFLLIIGGVFVIETLSVIIQVSSIKINHKPVFRMSPLHHHFELLNWKEVSIVQLFWSAGFIFSLFGLLSFPFH